MKSQKIAEATGHLIDNKSANEMTKVSKNFPQNNTETVTNGHDEEIPKERCISQGEGQKIIDNLINIYNSIIMKHKK